MNDRDSEALAGLFIARQYFFVTEPEQADVILVNTCSVREHAENRAVSFLGSLKKFHERRRSRGVKPKVIGLIGCMAQTKGEDIFEHMSHVNLVCGPGCFDKIVRYVEKIRTENIRIIDLEDRMRDEGFYKASFRVMPECAQVIISTGCSNCCSYCVVPYARGELRVREPADIFNEVKRNIALGIGKITLLGQNVNDYCFEGKVGFIELLRKIIRIEGIKKVDFISAHPKNTSKELFTLMAESDKISKHLHLPFQSGSDRILELMNRGYTKAEYLALVKSYRNITGGTLSTDVIVGFPTEKEQDFEHTRSVLEKVRFSYSYIFKYSPRPGTVASKMEDDVPENVKKQRHEILLSLQKKISLNKE